MERLIIEFSEPEELSQLDCDCLPPLPGEEEKEEEEEEEDILILRPPRFYRSHDSLRVAKHRTELKQKKTRAVKPSARSRLQPQPQQVQARAPTKKQETVPVAAPKPPPQTGESPTGRRGRNATRRVAHTQRVNPSQ